MRSSTPLALTILLNTIFYTHVGHSPTKTFYILQGRTHTHTRTHTCIHTHIDYSRNWVLILVGAEILREQKGFQFGFNIRHGISSQILSAPPNAQGHVLKTNHTFKTAHQLQIHVANSQAKSRIRGEPYSCMQRKTTVVKTHVCRLEMEHATFASNPHNCRKHFQI